MTHVRLVVDDQYKWPVYPALNEREIAYMVADSVLCAGKYARNAV